MPTVLLIRHGRTTANAEGVLAGWAPGVFLDETGQEQAAAVGARLAEVRLDALVSSPLDRTMQTADAIASAMAKAMPAGQTEVPRHVDDRIGECQYGEWTNRRLSELAEDPLWATVQAHPSAVTFPGGESMPAMQHRAVAAVRDWNARLGPDAVYAMVSHGDVIKAILADALGMHLDGFQRIQADPCSLSIIRYTDLRPFVVVMNDTARDLRSLTAKQESSDAPVGGGAG